MCRVPVSLDTGIRTFFCGPESFTPDLRPIIGPAPEVRNYFVAAGLNSIGILTGGGLGRLVAHWIVDGDPGADVTGMHPARLQPYQSNPEYRRTRTVESLGMVYQCHYPNKALQTARGAKLLAAARTAGRAGRVLPRRQRLGERRLVRRAGRDRRPRPAHVGPAVVVGELGGRAPRLPRGRDRDGHELHVEVPRAGPRRRRGARPDVGQRRQRRRPARSPTRSGSTSAARSRPTSPSPSSPTTRSSWSPPTPRTAMCESQLARARRRRATRSSPTSPARTRRSTCRARGRASCCRSLTTVDLSNEAFPFRTAREIDLGFARVLCVRITYLGELGYELYVPTEQAVHVYDRIVAAGAGVRPAPRRAEGAGQPADGEGLPRLRPRHRQHRRPAGGRLRIRPRAGQAGWFHRPRGRARTQGGGPARAGGWCQVLRARPRAADVPRRGACAATACAVGYLRAALVRPHARRRGRAGDGAKARRAITPRVAREGSWTVEINGAEYPATVSLRAALRPHQRPHQDCERRGMPLP